MDRFIVIRLENDINSLSSLKSNMDRFIDVKTDTYATAKAAFKIQYG